MKSTRAFIAGWMVFTAVTTFASPASAQRSAVPDKPHIVDAVGDANFVVVTDQPTPAQIAAADIRAVWFESTTTSLTVYLHVGANPLRQGVQFQVAIIPGASASYRLAVGSRCLLLDAVLPDPRYDPHATEATLYDRCNYSNQFGYFTFPLKVRDLADGTAIIVANFPRSATPYFRPGRVLTDPTAHSAAIIQGATGRSGVKIDVTPVGRDYRMP